MSQQPTPETNLRFIGVHTTGRIRPYRLGLVMSYEPTNSNNETCPYHLGSIDQAIDWLKQHDQPKQRGPSS